MSGSNQQIEDDFIAASQEASKGRSISSLLAEHADHADQLGPMLQLVKAIQDLPAPSISPEAQARIEKRARLAAQERRQAVPNHPKSSAWQDAQLRPAHSSSRRPVHGAEERAEKHPERPPVRLHFTLRDIAAVFRLLLISAFRTNVRSMLAGMAAGAVAVMLVIVGVAALQDGTPPKAAQQLETYRGVIAKMEPGRWELVDNTEMIIDNLTEIHGQPAVGAKMVCIAERLAGYERYRALEVWVLTEPVTPSGYNLHTLNNSYFILSTSHFLVEVGLTSVM